MEDQRLEMGNPRQIGVVGVRIGSWLDNEIDLLQDMQ